MRIPSSVVIKVIIARAEIERIENAINQIKRGISVKQLDIYRKLLPILRKLLLKYNDVIKAHEVLKDQDTAVKEAKKNIKPWQKPEARYHRQSSKKEKMAFLTRNVLKWKKRYLTGGSAREEAVTDMAEAMDGAGFYKTTTPPVSIIKGVKSMMEELTRKKLV